MNSQELADLIRSRFTPFAFMCECQGTEPSCFQTLRNPTMIATHETIERIATFIEDYIAFIAFNNNQNSDAG